MQYRVFAADYDGTLACAGELHQETRAALEKLRLSGRTNLLVTGRRVEDLLSVCPNLDPFERVVAENGAVLYQPATRARMLLGAPPPAALLERAREAGIAELAYGSVIVATTRPYASRLRDVIRELGLDLHLIWNCDAVMALPHGVDKASGLRHALAALGQPASAVVAVGDAENDAALLALAGRGVAVRNACPELAAQADWVTQGADGEGVRELIERLIESDLVDLEPRLRASDETAVAVGSRRRIT